MILLDVTLREGGLLHGWHWPERLARSIATLDAAAGVPWIEVGYRHAAALYPDSAYGPAARCAPDYLERLSQAAGQAKFCAMIDAHRADLTEWPLGEADALSMVRIAFYPDDLDKARDLTRRLSRRARLTIGWNPIAWSTIPDFGRTSILLAVEEHVSEGQLDLLTLVDTHGHFLPEDIWKTVSGWKRKLPETLQIGFHGHDNRGLALANSLAARSAGAHWIDGSWNGIGRGAGNARLEQLSTLLSEENGALDGFPWSNLEEVEELLGALRQDFPWGPDARLLQTGIADRHP